MNYLVQTAQNWKLSRNFENKFTCGELTFVKGKHEEKKSKIRDNPDNLFELNSQQGGVNSAHDSLEQS